MSRYNPRTLVATPSVAGWGKAAAGGIGVVEGYGTATGTPAVSGSYADGGFNWKRCDFTSTNTLVVSVGGLFDIYLLSGGGGGGSPYTPPDNGGSAAIPLVATVNLAAATYTVTIGAGGALGNAAAFGSRGNSTSINTIKLESLFGGGYGGLSTIFNGNFGNSVGGVNGGASAPAASPFGFNGAASVGAAGGGSGGAGGHASGSVGGVGLASTFTGTSVTYAKGGNGTGTGGNAAGAANRGEGGNLIAAGGSGVAYIRWKV